MTKIKNTKKGMAKKTLSMSLVVAMLATSNVPVWAAEFSDGTDAAVATEAPAAETFSDETAEAPVVEDTNTEAASAVTEAGDLILDNVSITSKATFETGTVAVEGTIKYKKGSDVEELKNYSYGWRVKGETNAIYTDSIDTNKAASAMSFVPTFAVESPAKESEKVDWSAYAGKTLELYVYNNEESDDSANVINIKPTVIGETTIEKRNITGTLAVTTKNNSNLTYNGKDFYYTDNANDDSDNAVKLAANALVISNNETWTKDKLTQYFDVAASKTAKNASEKLTVTATAKADSPYTGTVSATPLDVKQKAFTASDFNLSVAEGLSYAYMGNKAVTVPNDKVSFKEKDDVLAGADLSSAVKKAYTATKAPSDQVKVTVVLDTTKLKNFDFSNVSTGYDNDKKEMTLTTSGTALNQNVEITKRDLSADATTVKLNYGRVMTDSTITQFLQNLNFTDKAGNALSLDLGTDYNLYIENPDKSATTTVDSKGSTFTFSQTGTYIVTISAKEGDSQTCIKSQKINVEVAANVIDDIKFTNNYKPYYTGEEIKPSKSDLGKLRIHDVNAADGTYEELQDDQYDIIGYSNNVNASTYKNGTAQTWGYVEVKIKGSSSHNGQTFKIKFEIQPLTVSEDSVTVPKTITYNKGYGAASDYKVPLVVTAKDATGKIIKGLSADDYTVEYEYRDSNDAKTNDNVLHNFIKATIKIKNTNFVGVNGATTSVEMTKARDKYTKIVEKAITGDMIKINPSSYTYTGGNITPTFTVLDGAIALYDKAEYGDKGEYEVVSITNNKEVGTATVTVKGIENKYSGTASANFTITPANTSDVKVTFTVNDECKYTGKQVRPREFTATLNGNDVSDQFEIVSYGENISGKGTVVLKPVDGNKNFTGANITAEFNIVKEYVKADLSVFDTNGANVTDKYAVDDKTASDINAPAKSFDFDGTAKTFASEVVKNFKTQIYDKSSSAWVDDSNSKSKATASDFEIKYIDNISGKKFDKISGNDKYNLAYVYVVAKDGTGYTGTKSFTTADGTTIKNVVAYKAFAIKNVKFEKSNVYVQNATYAGGLPVKPNVLVQINGNTLVEGKDYTLELDANGYTDANGVNFVNVTDGGVYKVKVTGINGYTGSEVPNLKWGIDKKDIKDCDVKVTNGVVTVMNGYIPVPTTEYTSKNNGDGTYTVTATSTSKSYTGSKTVNAEGKAADEKPDAPMISDVKVVGNKATVILSGESDGASGYDYVISTDRDCITNKDYTSVNKNQVKTNTTFEYVGQNTYYAYCHAWKRDENGKKVFSDWSNAYPFVVSAITPSQPVITSVKVKGSTVTVTYTKASNADGYDVVLGTSTKKVNGETRPVEYGKLVKKNIKGNVVTATFKNVKKGTYYAGLHAFNRTSEDGKKVFSQWSNVKKVNVK